MRNSAIFFAIAIPLLLVGCGSGGDQPPFAELHPVKGVVKRGGQPLNGGLIKFLPDPDKPEFLINALVQSDGSFSLTTVRTTDTKGERKNGAPAGNYKVTYMPDLADQTAGGSQDPIAVMKPVTVNAGENDLTIELPAAKK